MFKNGYAIFLYSELRKNSVVFYLIRMYNKEKVYHNTIETDF